MIKQNADMVIGLRVINLFITPQQKAVIRAACYGEEGQWFINKISELRGIVENMPKSYQTDGQGMNAVAYLHYFKNGCDWYITEKDTDPDQDQAFGLANIGFGGDLGYISITELSRNGVELDLHFTPTKLCDLKCSVS